MRDMTPEKMWAIWNESVGFYVGTRLTRKRMIEQHTNDLKKSWDTCKENGDKAVQVMIVPVKKAKA